MVVSQRIIVFFLGVVLTCCKNFVACTDCAINRKGWHQINY